MGFQVIGIRDPGTSNSVAGLRSSKDPFKADHPQLANCLLYSLDLRDANGLERIFSDFSSDIRAVLLCPSEASTPDSTQHPFESFSVNANATLLFLEALKQYAPRAAMVYYSSIKVYGDSPNFLPFVEQASRWELPIEHPFYKYGIDEQMSIDQTKHSILGASKLAADIMAQEYGRLFGLNIGVFRGSAPAGPSPCNHSSDYLTTLMRSAVYNTPFLICGYKGKQVRDTLHPLDLASSFYTFCMAPRAAEVYNIGGGRFSNCSVLEAIEICEAIVGHKISSRYTDRNLVADQIWWISDTRKFKSHYPRWRPHYDTEGILQEIHQQLLHEQPPPIALNF